MPWMLPAAVVAASALSAGASAAQGKPSAIPTLNNVQGDVQGPLADNLLAGMKGGYQQYMYPGQLTAPITAGEQAGVDQSGRLAALAGNTVNQIGQYDPAKINSQFNSTIQDPALANWKQNIAPYLRESLNGFSSEQGNVLSRGLNTEANNLDQMRMGYHQQAQVNALNALNTGSAVNQANQGIQAIPREIQQAGLGASYSNFLNANQEYQSTLDKALGFLGVQTQAFVPANNPGQAAIAGAGAGANIYNASQQSGQNQQYLNLLSQQANNGGSINSSAFNSPGAFGGSPFNSVGQTPNYLQNLASGSGI